MEDLIPLFIIMPVLVVVLTIVHSLQTFIDIWERDGLEKKLRNLED